MTMLQTRPIRRCAVAAAAVGAVLVAGPARADAWTCGSSAVRVAPAGQAQAEPVTAGGPEEVPCRSESSELPAMTAGALSTGQIAARTQDGAGVPAQASATVRGAGLRLPELPSAPEIEEIEPVTLAGPLGPVTVDLRPALRALQQPLPGGDLLRVDSATASAAGRCVGGDPVLTGASSAVGVVLAGRPVDVDGPRTETVELLGAYAIDPSDVDPAKVVHEGAELPPAVLRSLLQPVLDAMAPIPVPAASADVTLVPGEQARSGGRQVYRGLHVRASMGGATVLDAVLAEAGVGGSDGCADGPGGAGSLTDLALSCSSQRIVLVDVLDTGKRVELVGAAAGRYAGRSVTIRLASTGKVVARANVREDGTFRALAPLPARRIRHTNAARYQASIAGERSLPLKLSRRMLVTRTTSTAQGTTLQGRVTGRLARRARITVKRRVSCGRWKVVKRLAMPSNGRFRITIPHAHGATSSVFRLQTTVGARNRNGRPKPTFTLPRYVTSTP